ncbi:HEAT repeat domain-containing protein [Gemmatimonadota bacterium]
MPLILTPAGIAAKSGVDDQGLLGDLLSYYEFERDCYLEGLFLKKILYLITGKKEGKKNRDKWIGRFNYKDVEILIRLFELKLEQKNFPRTEQEKMQKQLTDLSKKLADHNSSIVDEAGRVNNLSPEDVNLLIFRLDVKLLEEQLSVVETKLGNYSRQYNFGVKKASVCFFNDNVFWLCQALYYYLELSLLISPELRPEALKAKKEVSAFMADINKILKKIKISSDTESNELTSVEKQKGAQSQRTTAEKEAEKQAELLAEKLNVLPDIKRIKPLKEIARTGGLGSLKHILPLSRYESEFVNKLARNTVIKIIIRSLRQNAVRQELGSEHEKKLMDLLVEMDESYYYLNELSIDDPETKNKLMDVLIQEDSLFSPHTISKIILSSDEKIRASAVKLISEVLVKKDFGVLVRLLKDPDNRVRANTIEALETVGNPRVTIFLLKYKNDPNNRVRANTLKALWTFGYPRIGNSLNEMLQDPDPLMRSSALWVIGEIGHHQPELQKLMELVKDDESVIVQSSVRKALEKIAMKEEVDEDIQSENVG